MLPSHLLALLALVPPALSDHVGSGYFPPTDLTSNSSLVSQAWTAFTSQLASFIDDRAGSASEADLAAAFAANPAKLAWNITFSVNMFSLYDDAAVEELQFHHASEEVSKSKIGATELDGDTIYRVQSVTKLITAYAAMLNLEPEQWETPLIKIFPELKDVPENPSFPLPDWTEITPMALAAQISGVSTTFPIFSTYAATEALALALGLPPLDPETDPVWSNIPCELSTPCALNNGSNFALTVGVVPRVFDSWTTPNYANTGYILFGQALTRLTGRNTTDVIAEDIFVRLGMANSHTHGIKASELKNAVVPVEDEAAALSLYQGDGELTTPSGGVLSTSNDLAKLGVSILNHTLLTPATTRRWMKPRSHTARLDYSVGAPWEIPRYKNPKTGVVTDIYTKAGDGNSATALFILLPEFGVGFSYLSMNEVDAVRDAVGGAIGDLLAETLIPALSEQAALETEAKFGGTYKAGGDLNSTITLAINKTEGASPGLRITHFISNSTDVLAADPTFPTRLVAVTREGNQMVMQGLTEDDAPNKASQFVSSFVGADWLLAGAGSWGDCSWECLCLMWMSVVARRRM